ncbi:site-2 protease family protein [Gandjariella thermophila]|uniref:site-2 protease family protein n=1 Tax=Gandjariella thermophila TaxID=1931992 RepID=UPI0010F64953|nr:site-2 protease family protein [Gandjariella thermophila]
MNPTTVRPSPLFLGILAVTVAGGVLTVTGSDAAQTAGLVLLVLGGWAVSLCLHEFGHALVAYRGGDRAVRAKGYLTLDPRRYTDPGLSLVLPLLILVIGGIPLPGGAVWINHYALRSRAVESLVSLAGPLSNLVLGVLLAGSVELFHPPLGLTAALSLLALLEVFAFVLNILPVPGLDGFGALEPFLSAESRSFAAKVRPWAPLVLFAILIAIRPAYTVFSEISLTIFNAVGGNGFYAELGFARFFFWRR